jgi:uncharacterized paraquat-inducible protein A
VNSRWLWIAISFVVLLGLTIHSALRRAERLRAVEKPQMYLYCPECGLEMTCPPGAEDKAAFCPHCGMTRRMEVHSYSVNGGGPGFRANRLVLAVAIGVPIALGVAIYLLGRRQASRGQATVVKHGKIACPFCGHKLSAAPFGPGSTAVCPVCTERFVVGRPERRPESEEAAEDDEE